MKKVSKPEYLKAFATDPMLPKYKATDDRWFRDFPPSLKPHFKRKKP